jgi:hypothetical protein
MKQIKVLREGEFAQALGYKVDSLEGVRYTELVECLGEPTWDYPSGDDKVQKEWVVKFGDEQFTIYDWKTYDVEYTMTQLKVWSIGGTSSGLEFRDALLRKLGHTNAMSL